MPGSSVRRTPVRLRAGWSVVRATRRTPRPRSDGAMTTDDAWRDGPDDREDDDHGDHGDRRDGAATFRPVRGWAVLWRSAFGLRHGGHEYVVAVDFLDWDERIRLYRDGRLVDEQRS